MKLTKDIYILTHKKIDYDFDLSKYTCLQLGAAKSDKIYTLNDAIGDNISEKNNYFLEPTGIYWIWKNSKADIKGQMQYRRFMSVNPDFIETILNKYDMIATNEAIFPCTVEQQYDFYHNITNLMQLKEVINEKYPEYMDSYYRYIQRGHKMYYSNSFIAKREVYDNLCKFCFDVILEYDKRFTDTEEKRAKYANEILWKYYNDDPYLQNEVVIPYNENHPELPYVEYQKRICAYLFERIVSLYIYHNNLYVYTCGEYLYFQ